MSLSHFNRISCKILNKGACNCRSFMPATMLCAPAMSTSVSAIAGKSKFIPIGQVRSSAMSTSTSPRKSSLKDTPVKDTMKPEVEVVVKAIVEPESMKTKIKYMWKTYGIIGIGTYLGIYVTTLGSIFLCIDFDVFNAASVGLDPAGAIKKVRYIHLLIFTTSSPRLTTSILSLCDSTYSFIHAGMHNF